MGHTVFMRLHHRTRTARHPFASPTPFKSSPSLHLASTFTSTSSSKYSTNHPRKAAQHAPPSQPRQAPKPLPFQPSSSNSRIFSSSQSEAQPSPTTGHPSASARSPGGFLPPSKPVEDLRHYKTGLSFRQTSRRVTALMTALPFMLFSGYVLWTRWRDGTLNLEDELGDWGVRIERRWGRARPGAKASVESDGGAVNGDTG